MISAVAYLFADEAPGTPVYTCTRRGCPRRLLAPGRCPNCKPGRWSERARAQLRAEIELHLARRGPRSVVDLVTHTGAPRGEVERAAIGLVAGLRATRLGADTFGPVSGGAL